MFSYVAKSLLSKTLKTFLRKYLENIEFESISYGSNASNPDATGSGSSGWDVRLSNVKLREGMELMKLPGKRKRKVIIKKRVKRRKKKKNGNRVKTKVEHEAKQKQPDGVNNGAAKPGRVRRSCSQGNITFPIPGIAKPIQFANQHPVQPKQNSHPEYRKRSMSSGSEFDYFSSAPSTPVQQNTVLCAPLSLCSSSKHSKNAKVENAQDIKQIPVLPFGSEDDEDTVHVPTRQQDAEKDAFDIGPNIQISSDSIFRNNLNSQFTDEDSDSEASADSIIEVEEEQIVEDTMSLVVGAGGAIGTLNIRLVGKELHVTVEDAHLIIEALPMEDVEKQSDEKPSAANGEAKGHLRADSTVSETSMDSAPDVPAATSEDNMTFGEKIKKKSMFARYLSMIPHLFLRDCRVSIILPGESDFCDEESTAYSVGDCTVFECGIDFLSVTSGDDFMDVLRLDSPTEGPAPHSAPLPTKPNNGKGQSHNTSNVFSRKRIMTGKGPEGGLWVKIHPPNGFRQPRVHHDQRLWARQKFLNSSAGYFFRCSGLDLHARMLIEVNDDVKEEIAAAWSSEYDDYTMDSMLFGVDYVDPISLTRHQIKERMKREMIDNPEKYDTANRAGTDTDANGIQHIPFQSNFYWLDQQTHRKNCPTAYLPLHECDRCWNECVSSKRLTQKSGMDSKMPLPGFVFCLSVTDAIEVNVDRNSIDAIAYAISLMSSDDEFTDVKKVEADKQTPRMLSSNIRAAHGKASSSGEESFPSYMQPDATYLSGIHLSKVIVRVHAMNSVPKNDMRHQFRYWQLVMQSLFLQDQQIISDELSMRDITCHVGKMECADLAGVCERQILVAGSKHNFDLPFTASQVLDVSLPTILDTYAIHSRLVFCSTHVNQDGDNKSSTTGVVDVNVGSIKVDVNKRLPDEITASASEAMRTLFPTTKAMMTKNVTKQETKKQPNQQKSSNWMFQVSTHGGNVKCCPITELSIPETQFRGSSGKDGLSFDTFIQGLGVKFGSPKTSLLRKFPLCRLPETLRMHIFVFLDDLSPLENVLQIDFKKNVSTFLRSHTINKKLSVIKDAHKKIMPRLPSMDERREKLLKQLHELNDDALEQLLASQCRLNGTS